MLMAVESPVAEAISRIPDPEVPVISIADLGILRSVEVDDDAHTVVATITPTYSGCPAMEAIASRIVFEAARRGYAADVRTQRSPAWTTDWMTEEGRAAPARGGGRHGIHTEQMGYLLAEMQHIARSHPGATW